MSKTKAELEKRVREAEADLETAMGIIEKYKYALDTVLSMNKTLKRSNRKMLLSLYRNEDVREEFFADKEMYVQYLVEDLVDNEPNPTDPFPLDEWNKMWE